MKRLLILVGIIEIIVIGIEIVCAIDRFYPTFSGNYIEKEKTNAFDGATLWVDTQQQMQGTNVGLIRWVRNNNVKKNEYTLYLPAGIDLNSLIIYSNFSKLYINDTLVNNCGTYPLEKDKTYKINDKYTMLVKQSTLPSLYLEVPYDYYNKTYLRALDKEKYQEGNYFATDEYGNIIHELGKIEKLKGRGNSTWETAWKLFAKYPLNIKFDEKINAFNISSNKQKSWVLLANNDDETGIRNSIAFDIANLLNIENVPQSRIINLYLNGDFKGTYLICEKIKVGKDALIKGETIEKYHDEQSIPEFINEKIEYNDKQLDFKYADIGDIQEGQNYKTKSYLLEFSVGDRAQKDNCYFESPRGQFISLKDPENLNREEMLFIMNKWIEVEEIVYNNDYEQMQKMIDLSSFARVYILKELCKDVDAGITSYFVYYDGTKEEPIWQAKPVWDFDTSFGNSRYIDSNHFIEGLNIDINPSIPTGFYAKYQKVSDKVEDKDLIFQAQLANNQNYWNDYVKKIWNEEAKIKLLEYLKVGDRMRQIFNINKYDLELNEMRYSFILNKHILNYDAVDMRRDHGRML